MPRPRPGRASKQQGERGAGSVVELVTQHQCPHGWGLGSRWSRMSTAMPGEGGSRRPLQAEGRPPLSSAGAVQQGTECPGGRTPSHPE